MSLSTNSAGKDNGRISFAVGCFHFTPRDSTREFEFLEFLDDLRTSLERIPMISNLDWIGFNGQLGAPHYYGVEIEQGPGLGFHPVGSELSFDIFVPRHIQERMLYRSAHSNSEHIHVTLVYTWHFAVSIVEPLDRDTGSPSELVIVVRKCLEEYFAGISNSKVAFQSLGPSPFHANFFATIQVGDREEIRCSVTNQPGYDEIDYYVTCTDGCEKEQARTLLFKHVAEELSGFYYLVQVSYRLNAQWAKIEEGLDSLGHRSCKGD